MDVFAGEKQPALVSFQGIGTSLSRPAVTQGRKINQEKRRTSLIFWLLISVSVGSLRILRRKAGDFPCLLVFQMTESATICRRLRWPFLFWNVPPLC